MAKRRLDLGDVGDIADVFMKGRSIGELWKPPYQIDVTSALKPGANHLEIKVLSEWSHRIAGDRGASPDKRVLRKPAVEALAVFGIAGEVSS